MPTILLLCVAVVLASAISGDARAQAVELERFRPALDPDGFLGLQGTRTPGPGLISVAAFAQYSSRLLRADSATGESLYPVSDRVSGVLSAELGIGHSAALGFSLPVVLYQRGDALSPSEPKLSSFGPSDPAILLRYRFLGEAGAVLPNNDGPGLALQLGSSLPLGYDDAYAGEGAVRGELQLLGDIHVLSAGIGASVGVRHRFQARRVLDVRLRDEFTFGVGLKLPIFALYPLEALVEVRGATDFKSPAQNHLEVDLGVHVPFGAGFTLGIAGGPGLARAIGTPSWRVLCGIWYAPGDPDSDHDGVADISDACPPLPEDFDGFEDEDGCPDPDNDNDLVPDADDLCPDQQAAEDGDLNEDGCTD